MPKFPKQSQATNYIKNLIASSNIQIEPGILTIGEAEECQVFEHNRKYLAIDTKSGIWVGPSGGEWMQISSSCTVGAALEAVEYLLSYSR
jgi:hypothetical protein